MYLANESAAVPYPSALDCETLAEDQRHQQEILDRRPTIFFRPGDRTQARSGYWAADARGVSFVRFIVQYGDHALGRRPVFLDQAVPVRIRARTAMPLSAVAPAAYAQTYQELAHAPAVFQWLQQKYPTHALTLDSVVTVYAVDYVDE
jgi:hypothetical protein